jgi:putative sigma-54 modulation protein
MHIDLTGNHIELTDALRDYVNEKMGRLERHFDHVTKTHVILQVEKKRHIAEATVNVPGANGGLHATAEHNDMYAAIDGLVDKLDRQIIKHKEKITDHHRKEKAG